ncbi:hypothetical protein F53441_8630 [Fusarium austroafricanum]|uniref:Uncharacterized protein n=1 Tax=Fusarium austroafricanum TaxID=2364996 RepID=A0A8H4KAY5_9HYPO|nr:hypothetical protein F53441_8630 [Fusarium austroafricanum]
MSSNRHCSPNDAGGISSARITSELPGRMEISPWPFESKLEWETPPFSFVVDASKPIWGDTQGFKIRDLHLVRTPDADVFPRARWSLLPPKPETVWFLNLDDRARRGLYFKLLECDNPKITGYSACMLDGDLVDLHSHSEGEKLSFYHEGGGDRFHAVWLYFPVEKDERIVEVWRLRRKPRFCRDIPVLRTNKGRVWFLGTQNAAADPAANFERVTLFTRTRPCHFWYNYHGDGVDHLAFDSEDKRTDKNEVFTHLQGQYALCSSAAGPQTFSTSARLENVVELIPCRSWAPRSTGIVGLIFIYSDGHRESVGQVRLDHLLDPIKVEPTGDMWLGFRAIPNGGAVAEAMRVIPSIGQTIHGGNPSEEGLKWMRITWKGCLNWQFWYGRCFVAYDKHSVAGEHMTINMLFETWAGREWEEEVSGQLVVHARS